MELSMSVIVMPEIVGAVVSGVLIVASKLGTKEEELSGYLLVASKLGTKEVGVGVGGLLLVGSFVGFAVGTSGTTMLSRSE